MCKITMGDKCQSRHKFVPEIPESMRTAQLWHLRYQDKYLQPSVVTVLRERAASFALRARKVRSPGRRVQVVDMQDSCTPRPKSRMQHDKLNAEQPNHPDIRAGEALVCKTQGGGQVSHWALSKMTSGVEQWRQLGDMPPKPPPGRGGRNRGRPAGQGILSPVPRQGVAFEDKGRPVVSSPAAQRADAAACPGIASEDGALSPTSTYLPKIEYSIQQRRVQYARCV